MILAGERLNQTRMDMYDFRLLAKLMRMRSPTRRANFDLADASQMAMQTEMSLRDQALDADKARKASQTTQDASGEVKKGFGGA